MRAALIPLVLLLSACRSIPEDEAPLFGFWQRDDNLRDLTLLAIGEGFSSSELPDIAVPYDLLTGPGTGPIDLVEQGGFELDGEAMLWEVRFDADDFTRSGTISSWELHGANDRSFEATDAEGSRYTWRRIDALPAGTAGLGRFGAYQWSATGFSAGQPTRLRFGDDGTPSVWTTAPGQQSVLHTWDASYVERERRMEAPPLYERVGKDFLQANAGGSLLRREAEDATELWRLEVPGAVTDLQVVGDTATALVLVYGVLPAALGGEGTEGVMNVALIQVNADTGALLSSQWLGGSSTVPARQRLRVLDDGAVLVVRHLADESIDPDGTLGRPGHGGLVAAVMEDDGTVRWKRWLGPDADWNLVDLVEGPDGQVVVSGGVKGRFNLGDGIVDTALFFSPDSYDVLGMVVALDAQTGALRWKRSSYADDIYSGLLPLAARADGVLAVAHVLGVPLDLGGDVGTVSAGTGDGIAVALLDACGEARAARVFEECDCTYEDPQGFAQVWEAEFSPEGDLALGVWANGYYRFSGDPIGGSGTTPSDVGAVGTGAAGLVLLAGPDGPVGARVCEAPVLPEPTLEVTLVGEGTVVVGDTTCVASCDVVGQLFETLQASATPAEGYAFAGWQGACSGLPACELSLDDSVQTLKAVFEPTVITNVWPLTGPANLALVSPRLAVGGGGDVLLGARVQGELTVANTVVVSDTAGLPGIVVALREDGTLRWSARLDPPGQGGTVVSSLLGRADGSALVLTASARLVVVASDGQIHSDSALAGVTSAKALVEDDGGQLIVATETGTEVGLLGVSEDASVAWTVPVVAAGSVQLVDLVGLADGAAALLTFSGVVTVDGEAVPATNGRLLVRVDGSGSVLSTAVVPADAPRGSYGQTTGVLQRGPDGGLWLTGDTTRDGAAVPYLSYAEPINDDGALDGAVVVGALPVGSAIVGGAPMWALSSDWAMTGDLSHSATVDAVDLPHRGGTDLLVGAVAAGKVRSGESLGSAGDDFWMMTASGGDTVVGLAYLGADGDVGGVGVPAGVVLLRAEP